MKIAKLSFTHFFVSIGIALCAALSSFGDGRIIYVKPDGDAANDGTGGWSAATTLEAAVVNLQDGDELRLSKGAHYPLSKAVTNKNLKDNPPAFSMIGGYAGVSDDEEPTLDRYATIVSGDIARNDIWLHVDPVTGEENWLLDDGEPLYVIDPETGSLNLPPEWTGKYDCYYPVNWDAAKREMSRTMNLDNLNRFFMNNQGNKYLFRFENFTLQGVGAGETGGTTFFDLSGTNDGIFRKLAVIGCNNASGGIFRNNAYGTTLYEDIVYRHCRAWTLGLFDFQSTGCIYTIKDIVVEGVYAGRADSVQRTGYGLIVGMRGGAKTGSTIVNLKAKRIVYNGANASGAEKGGTSQSTSGPALGMNLLGWIDAKDCVFEGCWSSSWGENPVVWMGCQSTGNPTTGSSVANCRIIDCVAKVKVTDENSAVAGFARNTQNTFMTGWTMKGNVLEVTASDAVKRVAAAPMLIRSNLGPQKLIANSMFYDNACTVSAPGDAKTDVSRAILYLVSASLNTCTFTTISCAFGGSTPGSDLVFAQSADSIVGCKRTSFALDSIFSSTCPGYVPVKAFEAADHLYVRNCIVPNMDSQAELANVGLSGENYYHDPVLVYDAETFSLKPTVRVQGIDTSSAYFFQTLYGEGLVVTNLYKVMMRNNNTALSAMGNKYASIISSYDARAVGTSCSDETYPDAFGATRPDNGGITLGAVQVNDFPAGDVVASTVWPYAGGTVSPASATAAAGGSVTLTAVAADGYTFKEWQDEEGGVIGDAAELTVSPEGYTHVRAVFGSPKVKLTLSLDGKGKFTETGTDTCVLEADKSDPFPVIPEFTANEGWAAAKDWSPVLPSAVPDKDTTYTLHFMPMFRTVYFDSAATGNNDGTSWEDAFTDFAAAMASAGDAYRSELRIKRGVHKVTASAKLVNGVSIRGGYTGEGDARVTDPWATVFSGDLNGDDAWLYDDGTGSPVMNADGSFNLPNADGAHAYQTLANLSDNTLQLFDGNITDWVCDRGISFEGFTASGFGRGATRGPVMCSGPYFGDYTVSNCVFIANNAMNAGDQGVLAVTSPMTLVGCSFIGNMGTAIRCYNYANGYPVAWENGVYMKVRNCLFSNGYADGAYAHSAAIGVRYGAAAVEGCRFVRNRLSGGAMYYNPGGCIGVEGTMKWVRDCEFTENTALDFGGNSMPVTLARVSETGWLSNCLFRANTVRTTATDTLNPSLVKMSFHVLRCSFVDNTVSTVAAVAPTLVDNSRSGAAYANDTFAGNRVTTEADGGVGSLALGGSQPKFGFANCTFADNDVDALAYSTHKTPTIGFGNCVAWNATAERTVPLAVNPAATSTTGYFWSNTFKGYDPAADAAITLGYDDGLTVNDDPQFDKVEYSDDGLKACVRMKKNASSRRGAGADVRIRDGLSTSNTYLQFLFRKADGKWDAVNEPGQNLSSSIVMTWDILAEGVREEGKMNRGSVQGYIPNGFQILVR